MSGKGQKTDRRDRLVKKEVEAQQIWAENKVNQIDPDFENKKKYFLTFPYPYLNGRLHMGHAFSFTKCDFTVRFKRLEGYNVLFPQAFHCTGMPIMAAANRLKEELETYGSPPQNLPQRITDKKKIAEWEQEHKSTYSFREPQYTTLQKMNIPDSEIPKFVDPYYWTDYFPPYAREDLTSYGAAVDFRRSFITTDKNPYYNKFVEWQFAHLYEKKKIIFGKRPSIFSTKDNQMIADHDRSTGEGLGPQEYTLIKLKVLEFNGALEQLKDRKVFLVCATLRPETMYGQTNCYILPTGEYGAYEMKNNEVFICSERAAKNMAYQDLTKTPEKIEKICVIKGEDLLGCPVKAPLCKYEKVYALPMMTIKMDKGTGIVTSVISDSPDDWAAYRDLQNKEPMRQKFRITSEMVSFEPVPILDIPGLGDLPAIAACEEFKVKTQNDAKGLALAKERCYTKGFYQGILKVGKYAGQQIQEAKPRVKADLIESNEALVYWEPEGQILSRTGDDCIVSFIDQWYLNYADPEWKDKVRDHITNNFESYNPLVKDNLLYTVDWLKEWGCSRAFGLGTTLPFDKRFLIESLSDSTIYMSYYTIAHLLQGNVDGSQPGQLGIPAEKFTREVFDYIYLGAEYKESFGIEEEKLQKARKEFLYWYPLDLRCSGKDLIRNHLTMCLFNHTAIWEDPAMWPKSFYCNGWILVDGKKMAKSEGNFFTIQDIVEKFGADASRFACAEAGDSMEDANFMVKNADEAILKLSNIDMTLEKINFESLRVTNSQDKEVEFYDKAFESEILDLFIKSRESYQQMRFRNVIKYAFHEWGNTRDEYIISTGAEGPRRDLIYKCYLYQAYLLYPVIPHFMESIYIHYLQGFAKVMGETIPQYLFQARLPEITKEMIDMETLRSNKLFKYFIKYARVEAQKKMGIYQAKLKQGEKAEKKTGTKYDKVQIVYAKEYFDWQKQILVIFQNATFEDDQIKSEWKQQVKDNAPNKETMQKQMAFGASVLLNYQVDGTDALMETIPFDEQKTYETFANVIKRECQVEEIEFIEINEAEKLQGPQFKEAISKVIPKKAQIIMIKNE